MDNMTALEIRDLAVKMVETVNDAKKEMKGDMTVARYNNILSSLQDMAKDLFNLIMESGCLKVLKKSKHPADIAALDYYKRFIRNLYDDNTL